MNLESVNAKHLNELEQQTTNLLLIMRKAKVTDDPLYAFLQTFERELGEKRRSRFDKDLSEYFGY